MDNKDGCWSNGSNPGRRCVKPATNCLRYGTAYFYLTLMLLSGSTQ
jgi:hypothetical protein